MSKSRVKVLSGLIPGAALTLLWSYKKGDGKLIEGAWPMNDIEQARDFVARMRQRFGGELSVVACKPPSGERVIL
jgi:hypothetical protein